MSEKKSKGDSCVQPSFWFQFSAFPNSKMWTAADYKMACDKMMKKAPTGTSDPAGGK